MLPYWTNSGNRSWTVTVDSKTFICNVSITTLAIIFRHEDDCQLQRWQSSSGMKMIARVVIETHANKRNVANKVLLSTVAVQDLLPEARQSSGSLV